MSLHRISSLSVVPNQNIETDPDGRRAPKTLQSLARDSLLLDVIFPGVKTSHRPTSRKAWRCPRTKRLKRYLHGTEERPFPPALKYGVVYERIFQHPGEKPAVKWEGNLMQVRLKD